MTDPLILGIETSCDETAAAVTAGGRVLSSVVASQVAIHARYGGVVPEVASRQHLLAVLPVIDQALVGAGVGMGELTAVAVTHGPGLAGSLLVGVNVAKGLALARGLPLIGVNHLEAHIYANFLSVGSRQSAVDSQAVEQSSNRAVEQSSSQAVEQGGRGILNLESGICNPPEFPLLCLIVSGGHTDLVLMERHLDYRLVGRTRDDAAGEAFDKAARLLGLGYPGGPAVQEAARQGDARRLKLPRAWMRGTDDFSFSGLKTALWHLVHRGELAAAPGEPRPGVNDAAAAFQEAVVEVLVAKTVAVARKHRVRTLLVAGGVAANGRLRQRFEEETPVPLRIPPLSLCTDNAAMVAACGHYRWQAGRLSGYDLDAVPGLALQESAVSAV